MLSFPSRGYSAVSTAITLLLLVDFSIAEERLGRYVTTWDERDRHVRVVLNSRIDLRKLRSTSDANEAIVVILKEVGYRLSDPAKTSMVRRDLWSRRISFDVRFTETLTVREALRVLVPLGWRIVLDPKDRLLAFEPCSSGTQ